MKSVIIAVIAAVLAAGQLFSPALAIQTQAVGYCGETYIVRRGDSLNSIARKCAITLEKLLAHNPLITARDLIYPGQVLRIVVDANIVPLPDTHTVKSGETLGTIAESYDTSVKELLRLNPGILNPRLIYIGQELRLPGDFSGPRIFLSDKWVKPGWYLEARVVDFPPNADIDFLLSKEGGTFYPAADGITNADGSATVFVTFPNNAIPGQEWTVKVRTTETPELVDATSLVVTIIN